MSAGSIARPFVLSRQQGFVLGLLLLFVGLSVQYSIKAVHSPTSQATTRSAILRWRPQILELENGTDIYERFAYPNPPIMALLLRPLVHLSPLACCLCWFYLKVGMTLLATYWVFRLVESPARPFPAWAKVLTILLSLRPIMGDLSHGNINLFILFLVIGALYAFHRGRDLTAGVVLALGIACKVTPALFVPYFVWKRSGKVLAGCALGLVLFLWLVPGCFLGMGNNARLLGSWYGCMVKPFVVAGEVTTEHSNQSLPGLVYRLATHSPSSLAFDEHDQPIPVEYHNLLALDPAAARWLVKGCMGVFALLIVWSCRTPMLPRAGWRLAAEFSLVILGMLLFSERTWKHHCVTLLLPFAVIVYYLAVCRPSRSLRCYLLGTLAAVVLLMSSTARLGRSGTRLPAAANLPQVYGAYVWAYLLLVIALVVLLRWREEPEEVGEPVRVE